MKNTFNILLLIFLSFHMLSAQKIGIGTMNPEALLHIKQTLCDSFLIDQDFSSGLLEPLETGGDIEWQYEIGSFKHYAKSGAVGNNEISWIETTVEIPPGKNGILQFDVLCASSSDFEYKLMVDNQDMFLWNEVIDWTPYSLVLTSGIHNIRWQYKFFEGDPFSSFVGLDNVKINYVKEFTFRLEDGKEQYGRVLVSDDYGNGYWQTLSLSELFDKDNDTGIEMEKTYDSDRIEMFVAGSNALSIFKNNNDILFHTDYSNIMFGKNAGLSNSASFNTFIGDQAGRDNMLGQNNSFYGYHSGQKNKASKNTFIGSNAGSNNTLGHSNAFYGAHSGEENIGGKENTFVGSSSGTKNTAGDGNTLLGFQAGEENTDGNKNTFVGSSSGSKNTSGDGNTLLGFQAGKENKGSYNTFVGNEAGIKNTTGLLNVFIGNGSGFDNQTGNENTFVGNSSGANNTSGIQNTMIGNAAGLLNTTGYENTFLGRGAGLANNGVRNTYIGMNAGINNLTGTYNTSIGHSAGSVAKYVGGAVFIGQDANLVSSIFGLNMMALGYKSRVTGSNSVRIGSSTVHSIGGYASWTDLSDQRMKVDIRPEVPGLEFIQRLNPVSYQIDYQKVSNFLAERAEENPELILAQIEKSKTRQTGFLAQEVEQLVDEMQLDFNGVDKPQNESTLYGLRYAEFVVPLVKAVQEQQAMIEVLQLEIENLKNK